jgi:hypothetical protein
VGIGEMDNVSVRWELALLPKQDVRSLKPGQIFGYPVDSAAGCFMDVRAFDALMRGYDTDKKFFEKRLAPEHENNVPDWTWANVVIDDQTGANMVLFSTGAGDGIYPSFFGLNSVGDVVTLVTDFRILSDTHTGP